jgi:hypothetical protein
MLGMLQKPTMSVGFSTMPLLNWHGANTVFSRSRSFDSSASLGARSNTVPR